jgi:hypothetical protein
MTEDQKQPQQTAPAEQKDKPEVWFAYRSRGSLDLHKVRVPTKIANRWARKLTRQKVFCYNIVDESKTGKLTKVRLLPRLDYIMLEFIHDSSISMKAAKVHLQVSQSNNYKKAKQERQQETHEDELIARRVSKTGKITTQRMSFHVGHLDQAVILLCPVTGIIGKLEMPYCPVALSYEHPLARPSNVLSLLRYHFSIKGQQAEVHHLATKAELKLDRQVLAGCLLSLLHGKGLLFAEEAETTAAERNMVLQNAGVLILSDLLKHIVSCWENPAVWKRMPRLSVDWKTHASVHSTIGQTLQSYLKVLRGLFDPLELTAGEQAKIFGATQNKPKHRVKIYSASAVEHRNIRDAKTEAREQYEMLKPHLPVALQVQVSRTLRDLLLLPQDAKSKAAAALRTWAASQKDKPQAAPALSLAASIERATNEKLLEEMGSFMQEVSPVRARSIAEIMASKRARLQDVVEASLDDVQEQDEEQEDNNDE